MSLYINQRRVKNPSRSPIPRKPNLASLSPIGKYINDRPSPGRHIYGKGVNSVDSSTPFPVGLTQQKSSYDTATDDYESEEGTTRTGKPFTKAHGQDEPYDEDEEDDSGNEDEDLVASEEIILPGEDDEEEEGDGIEDLSYDYYYTGSPSSAAAGFESEDEESRIFKRQLSYPPVPTYEPPKPWKNPKAPVPMRRISNNSRDRLGVLTPMEEVTEPPSSAASSTEHSADRRMARRQIIGSNFNNLSVENSNSTLRSSENGSQKSILKSSSPLSSPERKVKFVGKGSSATQSETERTESPSTESVTSEYSSMPDSGSKPRTNLNSNRTSESSDNDSSSKRSKVSSNNNNNNRGSDTTPSGVVDRGEGEGQRIPEETEEDEESSYEDEVGNDEPEVKDEGESQPGSAQSKHSNSNAKVEEPVVEEVKTWQLGHEDLQSPEEGKENSPPVSGLDLEFPSVLDDIIAELHSLDKLAGTDAGITEINSTKHQDHLANVSSQLASQLGQISPQTVMTNLPQIIPLITTLLFVTESNFRAQLTSLNTVNVLIDRLKDCKAHSGMKMLPNADLTWLIRTLCGISSESSARSVLKTEGTSSLARLIKVAGPEMIGEPVLFILMGNDEKLKKHFKGREGSSRIVTTGVPGGSPRLKATALDALTFALLTFPRDNFELDVVAKLACHCLVHPKRRVRQAALECLAVVSNAIGPNIALPMFRQFILEEEEEPLFSSEEVNASNSSISSDASGSAVTGSGASTLESDSTGDTAIEVFPRNSQGSPSRIPIPIAKLLEANQKAQAAAPKSPVKARPMVQNGGPTPSSAVSARVSRHTLPTPSSEELVEYAVKIPAKSEVLIRQSTLDRNNKNRQPNDREASVNSSQYSGSRTATGTATSGSSERLTSSGESTGSSISNIDYAMLELEPVLNAKGSGIGLRKKAQGIDSYGGLLLAPDIAWVLSGTGPVKKWDPTAMLPKELKGLNGLTNSSFGNSSATESDFTYQSGRGNSSTDFNMRRGNRIELTTSETSPKDPIFGRYYYPSNATLTPRSGGIDTLSSRVSSTSNKSFGLLPNKYSIHRNPQSSPLHNGHGDYLSHHHSLIPGAYDHPPPYLSNGGHDLNNGYSSSAPTSTWSNSHNLLPPSEFGNLARLNKLKPLEPVISLREKYFDSQRTNNRMKKPSSQSDSGTNEEEDEEEEGEEDYEQTTEETEYEQTDIVRGAKTGAYNHNHRNPRNASDYQDPMLMLAKGDYMDGNGAVGTKKGGGIDKLTYNREQPLTLTSMHRKGEAFIVNNQVNGREYQVYHHQIEVDPTAAAAVLAASGKGGGGSNDGKRGQVDSAGSNHTGDSGVSLGSYGDSKTPPTTHNTPPSVHKFRETSPTRRSSVATLGKNNNAMTSTLGVNKDLHRNWQSTPDVPTASDTDDGDQRGFGGSSWRNHSGSPSHSRQSSTRLPSNQVQAQPSSSEGVMLLHRKPVLARRGQSVGRLAVSDLSEEYDRLGVPPMKYPSDNKRSSSHTRNAPGSGDRFGTSRSNSLLDVHQEDGPPISASTGYTYSNDGSLIPITASPKRNVRNSRSTGNLVDDEEDRLSSGEARLRMMKSKSTYLEITDEESSDGNNLKSIKGRVSRRSGPFGDVRATIDHGDFIPEERKGPRTVTVRAPKINGKIVPTKVYKGSFRDINSRKGSNGANGEVFPSDLKPVTSPRHALPIALTQLQSTEWETNVDGFRQIVRMIRYHPEAIRAELHKVNNAGIRHLANLRSQVCRSAILCFKELYITLGKAMEPDSEKISEKLLDKSADTNKFIREDSAKALDAMIANLTPSKGLACLDLFGTRHRNPAVRCMAARMTEKMVENIGAERCLIELPERLLPMLCKLLQEGSLETRTVAKSAMSSLMTHPSFFTQLKRYVPPEVLRHAQKSIDSLQK